MSFLKGLMKFAPAALTMAAPFFPPLAAAGPLLQGAVKAAPAALAAGASALQQPGAAPGPGPAPPPPITQDPTLMQGDAGPPQRQPQPGYQQMRHPNAGFLGGLAGVAAKKLLSGLF